ncbi:helix-turn-helix domain-containing protein [Roseateles aquatilis]|uniref:helix-turn-helix domain-containing protein n=1 Tax=Roseateles aquatilis TaxID=431061 RepID=UPI001302F1D5|nr:helix-turn-helix domain-containing protein [Roseateles aquatilis]
MRTAVKPYPDQLIAQSAALGARVRAARTRRNWRLEDLAARADLSVKTIMAIERGDLGTSLGAYLRALWAMGLNQEMDVVADAGLDQTGLTLELGAHGRRVRVRKAVDNDF